MISYKELRVLDSNSEYYGITQLKLMESAGKGVADFVNKINSGNKNIIIFCGLGNNGGDGFVAARYLSELSNVTVFIIGKENNIKTDISRNNFDKLKNLNVKIYDIDKINDIDKLLKENDIIIDSMLGIGVSGKLREPIFSIVKKINSMREKLIFSVDVPSGINCGNSVIPHYTITFHDKKEGMTKFNSGEINIVDIGIPEQADKYVGTGELQVYYPRSEKQSHKGENGRVLIVGGGPYVGAPALSGLAALRTGADLAYIATPKRVGRAIASFSPNLIVRDLNSDFLIPGDIHPIRELLDKCNSIVIGPGLGNAKETREAIIKIIEIAIIEKKPLVIDADAIKALADNIDLIKNSKTVITPHNEEFRILTGIELPDEVDKRIEIIEKWAKELGVSIFLKGFIDILSNGSKTKLNLIHNEAMTVGGTGDVLAGIIGALLSKDIDPFIAIRVAAFLNGEAGNMVFNKKSYGLLATDIIEEIPSVLNKYL
ncbi:MAG: NAD(P)H-hydrate dehydratase [Thermoplasmatales archaeon]|nr:NAD(P)H-hydrate dehydratase [Thermoplasmatales archaeon]